MLLSFLKQNWNNTKTTKQTSFSLFLSSQWEPSSSSSVASCYSSSSSIEHLQLHGRYGAEQRWLKWLATANRNSPLWSSLELLSATLRVLIFTQLLFQVSITPLPFPCFLSSMSICLYDPPQVLLLQSNATMDPKGDQNGLRLLLMSLESLKSIFLPNSTQFQTWKTHVLSSRYMCLSSIDVITLLPIYTNA